MWPARAENVREVRRVARASVREAGRRTLRSRAWTLNVAGVGAPQRRCTRGRVEAVEASAGAWMRATTGGGPGGAVARTDRSG